DVVGHDRIAAHSVPKGLAVDAPLIEVLVGVVAPIDGVGPRAVLEAHAAGGGSALPRLKSKVQSAEIGDRPRPQLLRGGFGARNCIVGSGAAGDAIKGPAIHVGNRGCGQRLIALRTGSNVYEGRQVLARP